MLPKKMVSVSELTLEFVEQRLATHKGKKHGPLLCGYSGPQGSGKTYNCTKVCAGLNAKGIKALQFSMDDFYLTNAEQLALQGKFPNDWMLQGRGPPGTHDVGLLVRVLEGVRNRRVVSIPTYDKSLHNGRGDRSGWVEVDCKDLEVVIFEGWFNGYVYIPSEKMLLDAWSKLAARFPRVREEDIIRLNGNLEQYFEVWSRFNCFVAVQTDNIENVYIWREQQEVETRKRGGGMTAADVVKFVDRYMPVYALFWSRVEMVENMVPSMVVKIGVDRKVVGIQ